MNWTLRFTGFCLILITVLPLVSSGKWFIRWWDFPRLQIAILLLIPLAISISQICQAGFQRETSIWLCLLSGAIVWQVSHIVQFSPIWQREVPDTLGNSAQQKIKLMVSNLDYENLSPDRVIDQIEEEQADILLLIELDRGWNDRLTSLRSAYAYRHELVRGEGLGMAIWSKLPLESTETKYLISDRRGSLWAKMKTESGDLVNFVGVHPTPPGLLDSTGETRRDSRVRDAELIMIAKEIASRPNEPWIVAGDFNDVAWSHTTRLFKRTSGLVDPRIGRGLYSTYIAQYPPCRCPIDHVFVSEGFTISSLGRKRISGSDHFAVLATLSLPATRGVSPSIQGNDSKDAKEIIQEGKSDAEERGVR